MGARWYAPAAGGFQDKDTVTVPPLPDPAAANPFAYAADNPLDATDPSGHYVVPLPGSGSVAVGVGASAWVDLGSSGTGRSGGTVTVEVGTQYYTQHYSRSGRSQVPAGREDPMTGSGLNYALYQLYMQQLARQSRSAPSTVDDGAGQGALAGQAQVPQSLQRTWQAGGKPSGGPVITHPTRITRPRNLVTDPGPDEAAILAGIAAAITTLSSTLALDNPQSPVGADAKKAADQVAAFVQQHAADIASVLTGIVVLGGCDLLTAGAGSRSLCPAAAGAASHAVSYTINAAAHGTFKWAGFGRAVLAGAAQWAAAGMLGDIFAPATDTASGITSTAEDTGGFCLGGQSFTAGTAVLLASGKTEAISKLRPGQKVLATDTRTGTNNVESVAAVLVHHDTDLYDLTVKTAHSAAVIHTTASHLFWDPYLHYGWIPANHLKPGEKLKTPDGQSAVVVGGSVPSVHDGWMWDLTVPGNNDHDFYVTAGTTSILVHNINNDACGVQGELFDAAPYRDSSGSGGDTFLYQKLSATGEHLKYGITDNPATRYTSAELNGGRLNILASGTRQDMLALERSLHETLPIGPEEGQTFYIGIQVARGLRPPPY